MKVAVFDFDGTLFRGDSYRRFGWHAAGAWRCSWGVLKASPWIAAWKLGFCSNARQKELLFGHWFGGWTADRFAAAGEDFAQVIDRRLHPRVLQALREHQKAGDRVVILSASYRAWIEPWARQNGIQDVIATEAEIRNGRLTGRYGAGGNCEGAEKALRLKEFLTALPCPEGLEIICYTDSLRDAPVMAMSGEVYMVTSAGELMPMRE